jgi:hypothetical protein
MMDALYHPLKEAGLLAGDVVSMGMRCAWRVRVTRTHWAEPRTQRILGIVVGYAVELLPMLLVLPF